MNPKNNIKNIHIKFLKKILEVLPIKILKLDFFNLEINSYILIFLYSIHRGKIKIGIAK